MANPEKTQLISKPIGRNIRSDKSYGADDVVSIVKAIKDIKLGKSGFLYVTDSNGDIVYAPVNPVVTELRQNGF